MSIDHAAQVAACDCLSDEEQRSQSRTASSSGVRPKRSIGFGSAPMSSTSHCTTL
jgi:hypothetical protein